MAQPVHALRAEAARSEFDETKGRSMLIGKRMSKEPVAIGPGEMLSEAMRRMKVGGFRRLPVVEDGQLIGIVTDRDAREHVGHLEHTKVNVAMKENPVTVTPGITLESAAQLMLQHKFGGLPVVDRGKVVGIITITDILEAFVDVMGASEEGTVRIDLAFDNGRGNVADAVNIIEGQGGDILGVGTYTERWGDSGVFYLRVRTAQPNGVVSALKEAGYKRHRL